VDITESTITLDVLIDLLIASHYLEDRSLMAAALACMRHRITCGLAENSILIAALRRVYEQEQDAGVGEKEAAVLLRPILLSAAAIHKSAFLFPGAIKDAFTQALQCNQL
jgi:hypothetical protein